MSLLILLYNSLVMVFAYLILAHKNPGQLKSMISALQTGNSHFFIHIDSKPGMQDFQQSMIDCPPNVHVCSKHIQINWGGFSMIEATVCLMDMLKDSGFRADYVHLLSGQDFPLCAPDAIDHFFEQNAGKNFIEYHILPYRRWAGNQGLDRIRYKWDVDGRKINKPALDVRDFPDGINPYGGSQWWSLTGDCVEWLTKVCRTGEVLYDFYRNTMIPDEMYFQTVILNSHFAQQVVNDNLRYIDFDSGPGYPRVLTCSDYDRLINSGKLFGRKFDIFQDANILYKLTDIAAH